MRLTEIDIAVLHALHTYYVLSASLLHNIVFPHNRDRRGTRRRLQRLVSNHFIARTTVNVCFSTGNAGPAYHLTEKGADALAVFYDDPAYLHSNTKAPRNDRLYHWLDIAQAHATIRQACDQSPTVELVSWINEWSEGCDEHGNPVGFVLHTQFREGPKPLSCSPDAAFLLNVGGQQRVHYLELDRGTTGAKRVAASKMPGYAELLSLQYHRRHFPQTTFADFSVLILAPTANRRNILQTCVAKHADLCPDVWLFADNHDFTPEQALHGAITFDHLGEAGPLIAAPIHDQRESA